MPLLDTLQKELKAIGPKVDADDKKIAEALKVKVAATAAYNKAKIKVRNLKAVRDPLRVEQMQLQNAVGNISGPPTQTLSNGGG